LEKSDDEMIQVQCTSSLFDKSIEYTISNAWKWIPAKTRHPTNRKLSPSFLRQPNAK